MQNKTQFIVDACKVAFKEVEEDKEEVEDQKNFE